MSNTIPLIKSYDAKKAFIYRYNHKAKSITVISQQLFLLQSIEFSLQLPSKPFIINLCHERHTLCVGFAAALIRNATTLLPQSYQESSIRELLCEYPDAICICDRDLGYRKIKTIQVELEHDISAVKALVDVPMINKHQEAAIAFTSGTTGAPSANSKSWGTLCGTAKRLAERFTDHLENPVIEATVPSQHMYGLEMTIMMALQGRCAIENSQPFYALDIANILSTLPNQKILVTTPIHLKTMTSSNIEMPSIHQVISATAPLSRELAEASEQLFQASLYEIYGFTEAGSAATRRTLIQKNWQLLRDLSICINNDMPILSAPYINQQIPIQDSIELISKNEFKLLGRANDIINVAGKRGSLAEINAKLLSITWVEDGVVFHPTTENHENSRPMAFIVSQRPAKEIRRALSQILDPIFLPRPIRTIKAIPRSSTGKILLKDLQKLYFESKQHSPKTEK